MNSSNLKFNINQFISQTLDDSKEYLDVFEELQQYTIPEIPKIPPSSPENNTLHTPRVTIEIPKDTFSLDYSDDENNFINYHIQDIQTILKFPKTELLTFDKLPPKNYRRPSTKSIDARHIWTTAKIPKIASIHHIELLLLDWAHTYASLEITDKKITKITWPSKSNAQCIASWSSFIKWIICACISR